jgi:hypothetical protein
VYISTIFFKVIDVLTFTRHCMSLTCHDGLMKRTIISATVVVRTGPRRSGCWVPHIYCKVKLNFFEIGGTLLIFG